MRASLSKLLAALAPVPILLGEKTMSFPRLFGLAIVVALVLAVVQTGADEPQGGEFDASKLIGTWKRISGKFNGQEVELPEGSVALKHVTPNGTIWLVYDKSGTVVDGAGGTYTLEGDQFAETPTYGMGDSFDVIRDQTHAFTCKIEDNRWHHTGTILNGSLEIEEVWERVELAP
jgi:hypothetical protein